MLKIHRVMPVFLIQYSQAGALTSRNTLDWSLAGSNPGIKGVKTAAWVARKDLRATLETGALPSYPEQEDS